MTSIWGLQANKIPLFSKYVLPKNVPKPTQCLEDAQTERDSKIILIQIFNR